jgi:uncharacterized protein YwbE
MTTELHVGDRVLCLQAGIDYKVGQGQRGVVTGFARFSPHHPREAMVALPDGREEWFWVSTLVRLAEGAS